MVRSLSPYDRVSSHRRGEQHLFPDHRRCSCGFDHRADAARDASGPRHAVAARRRGPMGRSGPPISASLRHRPDRRSPTRPERTPPGRGATRGSRDAGGPGLVPVDLAGIAGGPGIAEGILAPREPRRANEQPAVIWRTVGAKPGPSTATSPADVWLDDADALARAWTAAGMSIALPTDNDWNQHEGSHANADGNLIRFGSPVQPGAEPRYP